MNVSKLSNLHKFEMCLGDQIINQKSATGHNIYSIHSCNLFKISFSHRIYNIILTKKKNIILSI